MIINIQILVHAAEGKSYYLQRGMETLALTMLCSALMMYDAGKKLVVELTDCILFADLCQEARKNLVHEQTSQFCRILGRTTLRSS
jgi:hypothetical protein